MTAVEAFELTTQGGATDFARVIAACESLGPYCLIGGLAVNCYVEPVYTLDADFVLVAEQLSKAADTLRAIGFKIEEQRYSLKALAPKSDLRIQFTTDLRYQPFVTRSINADVLGVRVRVASLEDVTQGSCGPISIQSAGSVSAKRTNWISFGSRKLIQRCSRCTRTS